MAYAGLVSLVQTIDQILDHAHSPTTPPDYQQIIRSIRHHALDLQSNLEYSPERLNSLDLEGEIGEAANAAEDVIEYLLSPNNPSSCESFDRRLKQVAQKLESTAGNVAKELESNHLMNDSSVSGYKILRHTSPREDRVVAFEKDLHQILYRLCDSEASSGLQVLPIVGMGGIGKTTLAKLVYNHRRVKEHFDIQGWVTVSQDYDVSSIAFNLLASIKSKSKSKSKINTNVPRKDEIRTYLKGKRYLIVMDDMWSQKAWDDLRKLFPDDHNGSRIILTTRIQDLAQYVGHSHDMCVLNEESSWLLLRDSVFEDSYWPPNMEEAGRRIVKLCRGLPLSIVVMAGLLSMIETNVKVWMKITESDGKLETIISLNYIHLPPRLKPCFLYMGGFPEDYEIRASELIKLWLAEGFLNSRRYGSKYLENVAEDCLKNLVARRLVSVSSWDFDGKIKSCSLHDMVRDFCIRQGRREKVVVPVVDHLPTPILRRHFLPLVLKNYKRISATWYDLDLKDSVHSSRTHSIICIPRKGYGRMGCVKNFSLLRVLHVLCINEYWDWEPAQVFDLIYLTHLACNIPSSIIPPAISKLQNLQTLIIYKSEVRLPVEIWKLRKLRHLIAFSFHQLPHPEEEAIPLECLQTLSLAVDFICSERMVEMMLHIKKLGICYSGEKSGEGYQLDNLIHLHELEKLKLETLGPFWPSLNPVFPRWLIKLTLSGLRLPWREMTVVGSLPNLRVLKLRNYACDGELWETTEGEFAELRLLLIDESNLQHWTTDSSHFPRLECLMLHRCPNLSELPEDIGYIPTLQLIEIDDRHQSLLYSAKQIQEEQREMYGNEDLQVRLKRF